MGRTVELDHNKRNTSQYRSREKKKFNLFFARHAFSIRKSNRRSVGYLDYKHLATTFSLIKAGLEKDCLHSPNGDPEVVKVLAGDDVQTELETVENYLKSSDRKYCAYYYDGCGSPLGNTHNDIWPMNTIREILRKFDREDTSILATTVSLRGGRGCKMDADQLKKAYLDQIRILFMNEGFDAKNLKIEKYKNLHGNTWMLFCCWMLNPFPAPRQKITYLPGLHKGEYLGFRPE